ncbi:MAG: hypothetical protein HY722_15840 [Planctomycetes bacterium]|nr:hypothetical protein [Planctomycetota bacterium]
MPGLARDVRSSLLVAAGALASGLAVALAGQGGGAGALGSGAAVPALLAGAAAALAALRWPAGFAVGCALYLPFEESIIKWLPGPAFLAARYAPELMLYLLALRAAALRLAARLPWVRSPLDVPVLAFVAVALASMAANGTPPVTAALGLRVLLRYASVVVILLQGGVTDRHRLALVQGLVLAVAFQGGLALAQRALGPDFLALFQPARVAVGGVVFLEPVSPAGESASLGTLANFNLLGDFAAIATLVALAACWAGVLGRGACALALAGGLTAITCSASRQALVALLAGGAVLAWLTLRPRALATLALALGLAVVLVWDLAPDIRQEWRDLAWQQHTPEYALDLRAKLAAMLMPESLRAEPDGNFRLYLIRVVGQELLEQAPVLGLGPGRFGSVLSVARSDPIYRELGIDHLATTRTNFVGDVQWVTVLGQVGLAGLASLAACLVLPLRAALRLLGEGEASPPRRAAALALVALAATLVPLGLLGPNLEVRPVSYCFWLFAGLTLAPPAAGPATDVEGGVHHG